MLKSVTAAQVPAEVEMETGPLGVVEAFALGFETPIAVFSATMVDSARVRSLFYSNRILRVTLGFGCDCGDHADDGDVYWKKER